MSDQAGMDALGNLLQIEQEARQADSENAVEFIAVNDTWKLIPYRQAVLWRTTPGKGSAVRLVSGLASLPDDSPFRQWLNRAIVHLVADMEPGKARIVGQDTLPGELQEGWREWMSSVSVVVALPKPNGGSCGGLWLVMESPPGESETALLERLAWAYGQALWAWRPHQPWWQGLHQRLKERRHKWRLWVAVAVVALIPMRLTVMAPAEIIGKDAKLIGAPMDGVVGKFFVQPNQPVKAGKPVFALQDTDVRNRHDVALQEQAVARADYLREEQESFASEGSKAKLPAYNAKLQEKTAEVHYTADLLKRAVVLAPESGIVVYSDPNDWLGKPVQTGERIVEIADPKHVQISIDLPVDDALNLKPGAEVKLYLDASPLDTIEGKLVRMSYAPTQVPEGFVAYRLKADLVPGSPIPRIGLKGNAKVYGAWAPLIYHVLRRPISVLRRTLGI